MRALLGKYGETSGLVRLPLLAVPYYCGMLSDSKNLCKLMAPAHIFNRVFIVEMDYITNLFGLYIYTIIRHVFKIMGSKHGRKEDRQLIDPLQNNLYF